MEVFVQSHDAPIVAFEAYSLRLLKIEIAQSWNTHISATFFPCISLWNFTTPGERPLTFPKQVKAFFRVDFIKGWVAEL